MMVQFCKYFVIVPVLVLTHCANAQAGLILSVSDVTVTSGGGSFTIRATSDGATPNPFTAYSVNLLLDNYLGANLSGQSLNPVIALNVSPLEQQLTPSPTMIGALPDASEFNTSALTLVEFDPGAAVDLMTVNFTTPGFFSSNDSFDVTILPTTSVGLEGLALALSLPSSSTTITGVPEPGTALMMGAAMVAMGLFGWPGRLMRRLRSSKPEPAVEKTVC